MSKVKFQAHIDENKMRMVEAKLPMSEKGIKRLFKIMKEITDHMSTVLKSNDK